MKENIRKLMVVGVVLLLTLLIASTFGTSTFNNGNNLPPYEPSNPCPEDGERYIPVDAVLNWTGGDPDPEDIVTYDVYFGVTNLPGKKSSNQTETSYDPPGDMKLYEEYYWYIVSWDNHGASTTGPVWHFTTGLPFYPEVEIVNPREGYFHFSGIPLFPTVLNLLADTVSFGGFRLKPIQVNANSVYGEVWVQLYIDDEDKGYGTWNPETGYYEWRWTGVALGTYSLRVKARDIYGQESNWASLTIWNFCFIP